ncbi:MAG: peptidase M48 [Comamonadaceae bacterium]|nr:MAG: peptidase M48 [Comamonadaceae bacterium]
MERADFVHLVRLSEHASAEDSGAYRRSVAAFASLGYAWVVGCFVLAAAGLWWIASLALQGRFRAVFVTGVLAAGALLWSSARALWCKLDPPEGVRLEPADAPALFEALERIRRKVKGPPLHEVLLDAEFNASIMQRPRWGLFGGARNYLVVGLPLLLALDRQRVLAVLAHEYGHLRGGHGRFAAWVYRTRISWSRLHESMQGDETLAAMLTEGFLKWYFPRFVARTFALARQDEYEADRISGRLLGKEVAGAALTEIAVRAHWIDEEFWREHWALAADRPQPLGPYAHMRKALALPPPDAFARTSLRGALRRISDVDDTHPVLRDRLDALGVAPALPAWSRRSGIDLLAKPDHWIAHFDKEWCRDKGGAWKRHHAWLGRVRERVAELAARGQKNAGELVQLADLQRRLDANAPVRVHYEEALAQSPTHGPALQGLCRSMAPDAPAERLACLARLHEASPPHRWWAAQAAVAVLEDDPAHDARELKLWRERLKAAEEAEARAWAELSEPPFLERTSAPDLEAFDRRELEIELAAWKPVRRAWLLRKQLREFSARRCYVLVLDLAGVEGEDAWDLCRSLERAVSLPGPVVVAWTGQEPELGTIARMAGAPLYAAGGKA